MGEIFISDFKYGMDHRRPRVAGVPGTLWVGKNIHISRGGDIERPKKFVSAYTLPASTFGLAAVKGQLYVFGSAAAPALPTGVQYQRLQSPDATAMTQILDVRPVDGKFYAIARYASGHVYHFYDGARVTDWDALALANSSMPILADYMAERINTGSDVTALAAGNVLTLTAVVPGTAFTIARSTVNGGGTNDQDIVLATVQANVPAVAEVRATGTVTITGGTSNPTVNKISDITVNSVSIMSVAVDWISSNSATANAVAAKVNNNTATHGYSAVAVGAVITITAAPATGSTPNGYTVTVSAGGNVTSSVANMAGGVTAVTAVAQVTSATFSGTFEVLDQFVININGHEYAATGRAAGMGESIFVYKKRVWSPAGSLWQYSQINDFDDFSDTNVSSGAGFINVSNESEGTERLVGAEVYQDQAAIFSRQNCQIYNLSTDAEENAIAQPLKRTGALSSRSILAYGNTDVFYLDETGICSLKALVTGQAYVGDIGIAINPFLKDHIDSLPNGTVQRAVSVIEPRDARFMTALGERVYVLSSFPAAEINAWSYYEPGISISDFARISRRLYARAGDVIYLYGGASGVVYPGAGEMIADVVLPFVSSVPPGKEQLTGFNCAASGEWNTKIYTDPNNENLFVSVGVINGTTYQMEAIGVKAKCAYASLQMTCSAAGAASISNVTIYHTGKEP